MAASLWAGREATPALAARWTAWLARQRRILSAATVVGGVMFWGCPAVAAQSQLAASPDSNAGRKSPA